MQVGGGLPPNASRCLRNLTKWNASPSTLRQKNNRGNGLGGCMTKECAQERAEQSTERRSSARVATVFRPVIIDTEHLSSFCLVRNLSPFGLMGKVYTTLLHGAAISVRFHPALSVEGSVAWSKDGDVGVMFDQPIDVDGVLSVSDGLRPRQSTA